MRIIGEIPHPHYKITILKMNEKVTIQIEDRLVSQSFVFRDGTGVRDFESSKMLLTDSFMKSVDNRFKEMNDDYINALESMNNDSLDDFDII